MGVTGYDALEELLDEMPVLSYPKPKPPKVEKAKAGLTFVASDFHWPLADDAACDIFLQMVKDAKPATIVLNGDLPDLLAVSRYPKDLKHTWSLNDERKAMADFLWQLQDTAPQATIVETNANHSGNGPESRWQRYLSERIGELASMPDVIERLDYRSVFHPSFSRVSLVQYHTITKGLVAIHGDVARSHAAYSAKAMLEKWRVNLIHGHTHRMGYTGYRVPPIAGQKGHQMRAYEGGCMCRLDAPYLSVANWQQGFCIVRHDDEGRFNVEQVMIHEGEAMSTTLGGLYRAG